MAKKLVVAILVLVMIAPLGVAAALVGRSLWTAWQGGELAHAAPAVGEVQTACPLGRVNDPYPGDCRRYVDENANGICDLSEVPADAATPSAGMATGDETCIAAAGTEPRGQQGGVRAGAVRVPELMEIRGIVVALDPELTVATPEGEMTVGMAPSAYRDAQGFAPHIGDELAMTGFVEDGELRTSEVRNLTTGETMVLRQGDGRPMWAGQGRGRNR